MFSVLIQTAVTVNGLATSFVLSNIAEVARKCRAPSILCQVVEANSLSAMDTVSHMFDLIERDKTKYHSNF